MDDGPPYRSIATISQEATLWVAGLFLSLGFFGFLSAAAKNVESLSNWSTASHERLFGLFEATLLHNVVHLVIGVAALAASGADQRARGFLAVGGIALMTVVVYGRIAVHPALGGFIPPNSAGAWLHGIVAVVMFAVGVCRPSRRVADRVR